LVLQGCFSETRATGTTPAERAVARSVADHILDIDGFDWPDEVSVDGKTVTIFYRDGADRAIAEELRWEVADAIHYAVDEEGWVLVIRSSDGSSLRYMLPAQALSAEQIAVGGFMLRMPFNWYGFWTATPDSDLSSPPVYLLTMTEPEGEDPGSYTSTIRIESYETVDAAFDARSSWTDVHMGRGWPAESALELERDGFKASVTRLTSRPDAPRVITDLILIPDSGGAVRIVRGDKDPADAHQATRSLEDVANRLMKLFRVLPAGV
jgi:hypothetical protein